MNCLPIPPLKVKVCCLLKCINDQQENIVDTILQSSPASQQQYGYKGSLLGTVVNSLSQAGGVS